MIYLRLFACISVLLLCSCEQVEIPGEDESQNEDQTTVPIVTTDSTAGDARTYLYVYEAINHFAQNEDADTTVWVVGYIVGSIGGTTLNAAQFTDKTEVVSNILLADTPSETDPTRCIPIELKLNSTLRAELNLADNPANYGVRIAIYGHLTKYFRVAGLKSCTDYTRIDDTSTPDSTTTNPIATDSTTEIPPTPAIDHEEMLISGGRGLTRQNEARQLPAREKYKPE